LLVNAWWEPLTFNLPDDRTWSVEVDTGGTSEGRTTSRTIELGGRSLVALVTQPGT
jgi:pullulanase/glycogen debranching enzyme